MKAGGTSMLGSELATVGQARDEDRPRLTRPRGIPHRPPVVRRCRSIDMSDEALDRCQEAIGYTFKDPSLLVAALTHASIAGSRLESNERLEFLGDAVLGLTVCWYLFEHYPEYLEGEL